MIIQCHKNIEEPKLQELLEKLRGLHLKPNLVRTQLGIYIVALGREDHDLRTIGLLPGVSDVFRVSDAYKLVSRKWKVTPTVIDLGDGITIGGNEFGFMLGPCSIETPEQTDRVARFLLSQGIRIMRGGVFKPRTSPYSFRGSGIEGLKEMYEVVHPLGMKIISEVLESSQIEAMYPYVDIYQVGTRNTQNFTLLHDLGKVDKPVLIKRGMSGTLEELLQSAEYVFASGNERILLCERGIRTFERAYRNTLDVNAIAVLKEKTHLPVIVDPSHGIGLRRFVPKVGLAGILAGADGVLLEVHEVPEEAASDGDQTLSFQEAKRFIANARKLLSVKWD